MSDFVSKTILTAAQLNAKFNSLGYRGTLSTLTPKIAGSASGISGDFTGKFVAVLNAVCLVQIQLSFSSIGSNAGDLTIDIDGTNLFNGGALTAQQVQVVNVARLSGTRFPINTPLTCIVQGKTMRVLSSQYNGNPNRVLTNQDLRNDSYFEFSGAYLTGN